MSDEEHHFEANSDAGASKTYPQQAGTILKGGYIVIKNHACKVVEASTFKYGNNGTPRCHFVALDIFNKKKLEDTVPASFNCDDPHIICTDYSDQLINALSHGFVCFMLGQMARKGAFVVRRWLRQK